MLNWNRIDYSMKMEEIPRAVDKKLLDNNNWTPQHTIYCVVMAKNMLVDTAWRTFMVLLVIYCLQIIRRPHDTQK